MFVYFLEFFLLFILFNTLIISYKYFTLYRISSKNQKWNSVGQDAISKKKKHHDDHDHHHHHQRDDSQTNDNNNNKQDKHLSTTSTIRSSTMSMINSDGVFDLDDHRVDRSKSFALEHNQQMNFNAYNNLIVSSFDTFTFFQLTPLIYFISSQSKPLIIHFYPV